MSAGLGNGIKCGCMTPRASLSFLRLLCNLRWLAVLGQALTVVLVVGAMPIPLQTPPLPPRWMAAAATCSGVGYFASTLFGRELPPIGGMLGDTFGLHKIGMLANFVVSAIVIIFFFHTNDSGVAAKRA